MKRMHIHVSVDDINKSTKFYSALFGAKPVKQKSDYVKWMLDDPRVNFAISSRGTKVGLDHLGIQVDAPEELEGLRKQMKKADTGIFDEGITACCYMESDKSWVKDPSGIAWEAYHSMKDVELFNCCDDTENKTGCCIPKAVCSPESGCC